MLWIYIPVPKWKQKRFGTISNKTNTIIKAHQTYTPVRPYTVHIGRMAITKTDLFLSCCYGLYLFSWLCIVHTMLASQKWCIMYNRFQYKFSFASTNSSIITNTGWCEYFHWFHKRKWFSRFYILKAQIQTAEPKITNRIKAHMQHIPLIKSNWLLRAVEHRLLEFPHSIRFVWDAIVCVCVFCVHRNMININEEEPMKSNKKEKWNKIKLFSYTVCNVYLCMRICDT